MIRTGVGCALSLLALLQSFSRAAIPKETRWLPGYEQALSQARKEDKVILAYFSGSDWDPWTQKLETDVLNTDAFRQWAASRVVLLQVDFAREKHTSAIVKTQNEKLKTKYSVAKVPTFVFLDPYGLPFARAGYDDVRLRDEEPKGEPKAAIAFLDGVLRIRPRSEALLRQPGFVEAYAYAREHYQTLVVLVTHGNVERVLKNREELLNDQRFVKFVNRNVVFAQVDWPDDADASKEAQAFRAFAARHKLTPVPLQLVVWERPDTVTARISGISPDTVENVISHIEAKLPHIDYTSGWITDYNKARAIASQQDRFIFLAFTSMEDSEYSRKMDQEVFQTSDFKTYARKNLVLVRIDFPSATSATTQPAALAAQNKMLAELFAVRGYPSIVIENALGQKLVESKYMKGGPAEFLSELAPILQRDKERRAALKD